MLKVRGRFSNDDVADVSRLALAGLVQTTDVARMLPLADDDPHEDQKHNGRCAEQH